jgi:hypothetical protein
VAMLKPKTNMTDEETKHIKILILEELKNILQDSIKNVDEQRFPDQSDLGARRTVAYLSEAVSIRLEELEADKIYKENK